MSIAALQYDKFKEQAVREGHVFTFTAKGEYPVFKIAGSEAIPFWSSRSRLEKIQRGYPKYKRYEIKEMSLSAFLEWIPELDKGEVRIGANWSGKTLKGYDVECKDLLRGLQYWIDRFKA